MNELISSYQKKKKKQTLGGLSPVRQWITLLSFSLLHFSCYIKKKEKLERKYHGTRKDPDQADRELNQQAGHVFEEKKWSVQEG